MADLASLVVSLKADSDRLQRDLDKANKKLSRFERQAENFGKKLKKTFAAAFAGLGVAAGISAIGRMVTSYADAADQIQKLGIRLGASTEALSELKHAADLSGVSFETLTMGLQRMTRRVAEAAQGTGEAKNALAELGLSAADLTKLAPEDQFEAIADAINGLGNESDKVRLSMKLFDSEGVALIQTMEGGSGAIREAREEARRLGLSLSQDQANQAAAFNDAWTRLEATFTGAAQAIAIELVPTLTELAESLQEDVAPAIREVLEFFDLIEPKAVKMREVEREIDAVARGIESTQKALAFNEVQGNVQAVEALTNSLKAQEQQLDDLQAKLDRYNGKSPAITPPSQVPGLRITPSLPSPTGKTRTQGKSAAEREAEKFASALRSLQDELDPVSAKTRDYLENVALLDRAWAEGQISGQRYQELMAILATDVDAVREAEAALAADRERALGLIKDLDPGAVYRDQIAEVQRLRDLFPELSDALAEVELNAHDAWDAIGDEGVKAAEEVRSAWEELGPTFSSAFEDAIVEGKNLSDVLKGLEQDIIRIATRKLVTEPLGNSLSGFFGSGGAGGNFLSSLIPGFASGGTFMVGGSGGTDSQLVAFRASPNERVTVETPSQQGKSGGVTIINQIAVPQDTTHFRRSAKHLADETMRQLGMQGASF